MKRLRNVLTLLMVTYASVSYSQSFEKLDAKFGFNIFKLGSSLKDVKDIASISKLKIVGATDKYITSYKVDNPKNYTVFENEISNIKLVFYKEFLLEIQVYCKDFKRDELNKANYALDALFTGIQNTYGPFKVHELNVYDKLQNASNVWEIIGKKTKFYLMKFNNNESDSKSLFKGALLQFINIKLQDEQARDLSNNL